MELKELPAELASFVEHALASGTYPSTDALVADAVRVLRDQEAGRLARSHTPDAPPYPDVATSTPDDLVQAIRQALETGEAGRAPQNAGGGAHPHSGPAGVQNLARGPAPPTAPGGPPPPAAP